MVIPYIDPTIKHVQTTKLRSLNATALRELDGLIVIHSSDWTPLAVLMPYEQYLKLQAEEPR